MRFEEYLFNCSREYVSGIHPELVSEIASILSHIPVRNKQAEINNDLFWLLTDKGWAYDTLGGVSHNAPSELKLADLSRSKIEGNNDRLLCLTTTTLDASWHCDFAKKFPSGLVQIEVQFGKVESMFKDFCGFRISHYEKRLALVIEIVMLEPYKYFAHRRNAIGGMAYFEIAKKTLPAIGLDCPIWLIGLTE